MKNHLKVADHSPADSRFITNDPHKRPDAKVGRWLLKSGGEGSRTPVLKTFHEGIYKFSRAFAALRSMSLTRPVH